MRNNRLLFAALLLTSTASLAASQSDPATPPASEQVAVAERVRAFKALDASLHPQTGEVMIPGGHASLNLGDRYYFLPAAEARRVLSEAWGNPPDALTDVLGLVLPKGKKFYGPTWGAVVQYDDTGHIEDKDAASEDFDRVLSDLKSTEQESNKARREAGYAGGTTIGWAQAPTYDPANRTLIWARNIRFDREAENTLNYDVRTLGREGTLSLNMVDTMANLGAVKIIAADLGQTVEFNPGQGYADFNSDTDRLADYGLAGLVAGGVGLAVAKKAGLIGLLLLFFKKGFVVVLLMLAGGWKWIARKLGFGKEEEAETWDEAAYSEPEPLAEEAVVDEDVAGEPGVERPTGGA